MDLEQDIRYLIGKEEVGDTSELEKAFQLLSKTYSILTAPKHETASTRKINELIEAYGKVAKIPRAVNEELTGNSRGTPYGKSIELVLDTIVDQAPLQQNIALGFEAPPGEKIYSMSPLYTNDRIVLTLEDGRKPWKTLGADNGMVSLQHPRNKTIFNVYTTGFELSF